MTKSYEERVAILCGVNAAILFTRIKYWTGKNAEAGKNYHDGRTWMYETLDNFISAFPFLSKKEIRNALKTLCSYGLIMRGNYNKTRFDRTTWYALTDEGEEICRESEAVQKSSEKSKNAHDGAYAPKGTSKFPKGHIEDAEKAHGSVPKGTPIPYKETSIETECINQNIIFSEDDETSTRSADNSFSIFAKEILSELGMKREPTKAELTLYEKWRTEFLLPHDVILKSCELTGRAAVPSFTYLDKVLNSLREGGVCDMATYEKYKDKQKRHEDYCSELFAKMGLSQNPTFTQRERIRQFLDEYHLSRDILNLAADRARQNSTPYDYLCRAATSLYERDIISSMSEARDYLDRSSKTQAYSPVKRDGYAMHHYTAEDLAHIGVDLDE